MDLKLSLQWWEERSISVRQRLVLSPILTFCIQLDVHGLTTRWVKDFFLTFNLNISFFSLKPCFKRRCHLTFTCAGPQTCTSKLLLAQVSHDKISASPWHMGEHDSCNRRTTLISCLGTPLGTEKEDFCPGISEVFYKAFLGELTLQRNTFTTKHLLLHSIHSLF